MFRLDQVFPTNSPGIFLFYSIGLIYMPIPEPIPANGRKITMFVLDLLLNWGL